MPKWSSTFALPAPYKSAYGGRASGKTTAFARLLAAQAYQEPLNIMCCREFQSSIDASAKAALEKAIFDLGLSGAFRILTHEIRGLNGSRFRFRGVERGREEIRGWEGVDRVWVEEAQRLTEATATVLVPTVTRKPGCEVWFSWNPVARSDWVWQRFVVSPRESDVVRMVNWRDNPWFPAGSVEEREQCLRETPELYDHIWEGKPDDAGATRVLPYSLLELCVEAGKRAEWTARFEGEYVEIGLDVADTGDNFNALAIRRGPLLAHVEKWASPTLGRTARRADRIAREVGAARVHYDAGGVGAGVRSYFAEMGDDRPYSTRPEIFGSAVKGPKTTYSYKLDNTQFFARRNAQLGWALRLRALATQRLLNGEDVELERCLLISPKIERMGELLSQLAQPEYRENEVSGKIEIAKRDEDEASPDLYDAAILAFARDSANGLRART